MPGAARRAVAAQARVWVRRAVRIGAQSGAYW